MLIKYVIGDATEPQGEGNKIIAHVCNDMGLWGSGFVMALSKKWPAPEVEYRKWAHGTDKWFGLGEVQIVQVESDTYVANMVAQRGVRGPEYKQPLRYDYLDECLWQLDYIVSDLNATVHMPRIGCGLAGGKWESVSLLINRYSFADKTTVYDLE